jgi:uncharacterized protein
VIGGFQTLRKAAFSAAFFVAANMAHGADIEDRALIAAAGKGDVAAVTSLLANGAKLEARDDNGRTPLLVATRANRVEAARVLIAAGADVNAKDNIDDSPFLYAGAEGRNEILKLTLAAGADLATTNRYGGRDPRQWRRGS